MRTSQKSLVYKKENEMKKETRRLAFSFIWLMVASPMNVIHISNMNMIKTLLLADFVSAMPNK